MTIPRENLDYFLHQNKGYEVLKRCKDTTIIRLPNGDVLKILDAKLLEIIAETGYDLETRLAVVDELREFDKFAWPSMMLEDKGIITSYVMPYISGVDFTDYNENIYDLASYAKTHTQIEDNIKAGNKVGVVFPDLCTTENIRITEDRRVIFIDYDGLQIKDMQAVGYSDFLGTPRQVLTGKYFDLDTNLFSKELDIKSAIFLYFVDVFGIDLSAVNTVNPVSGKAVSLDTIFSLINLDDPDIQHKVWKVFSESSPNEFLGDDLYRMADKYKLVKPFVNAPIKRLYKK